VETERRRLGSRTPRRTLGQQVGDEDADAHRGKEQVNWSVNRDNEIEQHRRDHLDQNPITQERADRLAHAQPEERQRPDHDGGGEERETGCQTPANRFGAVR